MTFRRLWIVAAAVIGLIFGFTKDARTESQNAGGVDVILLWTAPGDDDFEGYAAQYDIRFSTNPITELKFNRAFQVPNPPIPGLAGSLQFCIVHGLLPNTDYYFAMRTADERGNWSTMSNVAVHSGYNVGVGGATGRVDFSSPIPNPCVSRAFFSYELTSPGAVSVAVFDVMGREVRSLLQESSMAGRGQLEWDLRDDSGQPVGAGIYFVRAQLGGKSFMRRAMVVR